MATKQLIAVLQINSTKDIQRNLDICRRLIAEVAAAGAKMVFLPECFRFVGERPGEIIKASESVEEETVTQFRGLAAQNSLWISLGGFHEKVPNIDKVYNTHLVIDSSGSIVAQYRKLHLFDVDIAGQTRLKESDTVLAGRALSSVVDTPVGKLGLGICYDVRFPDMAVALRKQGAEVLTYPSAFTVHTGMAHWEVLLRARAIENQCYVVAAAQWGEHNSKRRSYGHAMVVDPWGAVTVQCSDGVGYCLAHVDLDQVHRVRREMPVFSHRREDVY